MKGCKSSGLFMKRFNYNESTASDSLNNAKKRPVLARNLKQLEELSEMDKALKMLKRDAKKSSSNFNKMKSVKVSKV
jgi:hypothetical protein